jgi:carboxymethylenebutenolidase
MCDKDTIADYDRALARRGLSRRQFAVAGTAALLASCARAGEGAAGGASGLTEQLAEIVTPDGKADAFFVHPGNGRHPGVVMWPDIAGLRDASKEMARSLAAAGFAVLVVNQYYRNARAPVLKSLPEYFTPEAQARLLPMREAITPAGTLRDAAAFVAFLDGQDAVDPARRIGTCGYCMGGPFAVRTAVAVPTRVGAVASMHGAWLVTDQPDSPHRILRDSKASFLFAIGQNDDAKAPGDKDALREAASAAGRPAEIEVYPADHGWCALDAPFYDKAQADRANARMIALFASAL